MSFEIYYFTGTGNSLVIARGIAERIKGTLIPIPAVMNNQSIKTSAGNIGIVFPSYMAHLYGIPLIVERFVKKLEDIGSKYIFAVCTCGGYESVNALPTLKNLAKLIRSLGGKLSAEYSIRLPMNNLDYRHIPIPIDKNQETMFKKCEIKLDVICQRIINGEKDKHRVIKSLFNISMTPMYLILQNSHLKALKKSSKEPDDTNLKYYELMPLTDKSIYVDEKCDGCGICAKICPVQNIEIIESKPVWQHHCEMCYACDEWCPVKAIHHWGRAEGIKYHHPNVNIPDMLRQSKRR
jgi:formate hydrogenlyase subunit 6/NADH:ubiquinone oxidoreductase subunit I/flavodoxin